MSSTALLPAIDDFLVREQVRLFKAANNFDIYDPATAQLVLTCREPKLGFFTKLLRFTDYKRMTPFALEVRTPTGELALRVTRGVSIFLSRVEVLDGENRPLGTFQQKLWSIGGKFDVLDPSGQSVATLQGKWTGWEFRFLERERELAKVTKKWAGVGKELFTSADNYMLSMSPELARSSPTRALVLAAVLCIDMVLKE